MDPPLPPPPHTQGPFTRGASAALSISNFKKKKRGCLKDPYLYYRWAGKTGGWVVYLFPHMLESTSCFPNDSRELFSLF